MSSNCYQCGCDPDHQPKVVAALKSRVEELTKALEAAKEFADDEFSDCGDLNRKNRICRLCDLIDRALAMPLEQSGSGK